MTIGADVRRSAMGGRAVAGSKDLCRRVEMVLILRAGDGGRCFGRCFHAFRRRQKLKQEYARLIWASSPPRKLLSEIAVEGDGAEARLSPEYLKTSDQLEG
jgi:hypothetical protein